MTHKRLVRASTNALRPSFITLTPNHNPVDSLMTELGSISFDPQFCLFGSGSMLPTIPMSVISYKVGLGRNIQYPIKLLFFTINMPSIKHRNDSNNT